MIARAEHHPLTEVYRPDYASVVRNESAPARAAGSWKDEDHPELRQGAAKWVKKLRREYDRRFEKVTAR